MVSKYKLCLQKLISKITLVDDTGTWYQPAMASTLMQAGVGVEYYDLRIGYYNLEEANQIIEVVTNHFTPTYFVDDCEMIWKTFVKEEIGHNRGHYTFGIEIEKR